MNERDVEPAGDLLDAPNQQVVRPDASAPWEEGEGGSTADDPDPKARKGGLDGMTKDELLAYAKDIGASPANASMTKDEVRESIDAAEADTAEADE